MKILIFLLTFSSWSYASTLGVSGKVHGAVGCAKKVMVWLSLDSDVLNERKLLMHTEVPVGGSYKFYTKPGKYQIRASDEVGCEYLSRIEIGQKELTEHVRMVKK